MLNCSVCYDFHEKMMWRKLSKDSLFFQMNRQKNGKYFDERWESTHTICYRLRLHRSVVTVPMFVEHWTYFSCMNATSPVPVSKHILNVFGGEIANRSSSRLKIETRNAFSHSMCRWKLLRLNKAFKLCQVEYKCAYASLMHPHMRRISIKSLLLGCVEFSFWLLLLGSHTTEQERSNDRCARVHVLVEKGAWDIGLWRFHFIKKIWWQPNSIESEQKKNEKRKAIWKEDFMCFLYLRYKYISIYKKMRKRKM